MSGVRSLRRGPTLIGVGGSTTAPIYVDSDDNIAKFVPAGSGTTEVQLADVSSTQTFTNKTLTSPTLTTPVITGDVNASGSATPTLTSATTGALNLFDAATVITYTLPTPAVGLTYEFFTSTAASGTNHKIITNVGTVYLVGAILAFTNNETPGAAPGPKLFPGDGTSHVAVTQNATSTGGQLGSYLKFVCISTTRWAVTGWVHCTNGSTVATPFATS